MFDIMDSARNAIDAYETGLRLTSSNISNLGTTGFKGLQFSFQQIFERVLREGSGPSTVDQVGGINPTILGGGMGLGSVALNFSQGDLTDGEATNVAVSSGTGMFLVSGDGGRTFEFSRAGNFRFDAQGNLVTATGFQVYGFPGRVNAAGGFGRTGSSPVPITFVGTGRDTSAVAWNDAEGVLHTFTRNAQGVVVAAGAADAGMQTFQVALARVPNPSGLRQTTGTNFVPTTASGEPSAAEPPGGLSGTVAGRRVEQANVVFIRETINSLELQRAISGNLSVIRLVSDLISSFISQIR